MDKKSEVGVSVFVKLAAVAIVLVLFIILTPSFIDVLEGAVQTGECQWDLFFSAVMQAGSGGLAGSGRFNCSAVNVTITMNSLYEYQLEAAERMEVYRARSDDYHAMIAEGFGVSPKDNPSLYYDKQLEWAMNKIIADKMLWCWNRVWKGNLPVFDQWWNLVDFTFFGVGTKKPPVEKLKDIKSTDFGFFTTYGPPTFCAICARVYFDRDVRLKFGNKPITSLKDWMASNPAPDSKISYLQEFEEGQTLAVRMLTPKYVYTASEPHAIVFKRVNPHKITSVARTLGSLLSVSDEAVTVNQVVIAPYDKIVVSTEEFGLGCYPPVVD